MTRRRGDGQARLARWAQAACLALACACSAGAAKDGLLRAADTSAGTIITNRATITFLDGRGNRVDGESGIAQVSVAASSAIPSNFVLDKISIPSCDIPSTPAEPIRYELAVQNTGGAPETISVISLDDGSTVEGVLLIDPVPANTLLAPGTIEASPGDAIAVLHARDTDLDEWIRADSWTGTPEIDRVGLVIPESVAILGQVAELAFEVNVRTDIDNGTPIFNQAGIDITGDGSLDVVSPQVCNFIESPDLPNPEIRFLRPANAVFQEGRVPVLEQDADWVDNEFYQLNPTDILLNGVWLQLDASQLNFSSLDPDFFETEGNGAAASQFTGSSASRSGGESEGFRRPNSSAGNLRAFEDEAPQARLLQVLLSSLGTGDSVPVTMMETGPDTGDFRSVFPIFLSESPIPGVTDAEVTCPDSSTTEQITLFNGDTDPQAAIDEGCALHAIRLDQLQVTFDVPVFGPGGEVVRLQAVQDAAAVDPAGTVFDSRNGEPVSGATVRLFQSTDLFADTGAASCADLPASAYERALDPFSGQIQPVEVTDTVNVDNDRDVGDYAYPFVTPGHCYYLDVDPPEGYRFPSVRSPAEVEPFRSQVFDASYGLGGFEAAAAAGNAGAFLVENDALTFDIPLDFDGGIPANPLEVVKTVDRQDAGVGDVLVYRVEITNQTDVLIEQVRIVDELPYGFRYVDDTTVMRVSGTPIADAEPDGAPGPRLVFELGAIPLAPGESAEVIYALRVSAGAIDGRGVNSASGSGITEFGTPVASNVDRVRVKVEQDGVLSARAIVFGKVYVDSDCDGIQSEGEWPIGGVRLVMEDGTWAITDENGQYSLFDLDPGDHVLRVDPVTLPEGAELKIIDTRQAGRAHSRFLDLVPGEMHRADFAARCPGTGPAADALMAEIRERNQSIDGSWMLDAAERFDPLRNVVNSRQTIDADGGISGRQVGAEAASAGADRRMESAGPEPMESNASPSGDLSGDVSGDVSRDAPGIARGDAPGELDRMPAPETAVSEVTREQGRAGAWLWPRDGRSTDGRFLAVIRAGVDPSLHVNDAEVPESQLGEQIVNVEQDAQIVAWYGVELAPGENRVEVRATDPFGNERVMLSTTVVRPGAAQRLHLQPVATELEADGGASTLEIRVALVDGEGNPASGQEFVTLETTEGSWLEEDVQDRVAGHQVRVADGAAVVHLRSSRRTGRFIVRASVGELEATAELAQIAPARPLMVVGLASVTGTAAGNLDDEGRAPDSEITQIGENGYDQRLALFMQGQVRFDAHLTLSYDSEKDTGDDDLLRDIRPDGGVYPIPGDASQRGFDAQSRSPLYVKLERDRSSVMWGDYVTDNGVEFTDLGRVQKTLTGANLVFDNGSTRVQGFYAELDETRISVEFPANGTALEYGVRNDIVRHSEVIELRTRDRDTPGVILTSVTLARFEDYTIDYLTGRIEFYDSIPSLDQELNPISIFITYDVEGTGEEYETAGVRITQKLGAVTVTASHVFDGHETNGFELSGMGAHYDNGDGTRASVSVATMENRVDDSRGEGYFIELEHDWDGAARTRATFGRGEDGFRNASGGVSENRQELRLEHTQPLMDRLDLRMSASHSERLDSDEQQTAGEASAVMRVGDATVDAGLRVIEQQRTDGTDRFTTARAGIRHGQDWFGMRVNLGAEIEQALEGADRRRIALTMDWDINDRIGAYGTYELTDSLTGTTNLTSDDQRSNLVFGLRTNLIPDTETFSEYRMRGTNDGRNEVSAQGVRGNYEIIEGVRVSPAIEHISTINGPNANDGISLSIGIVDERHRNVRRRLRLESRWGDTSDFHGVSAAWVARLSETWSASVREELRWDRNDAASDGLSHVLTVGLARRPRLDNAHHLLMLYRWEEDRSTSGIDRSVHLFSTHQNLEITKDLLISGRVGVKFGEVTVNGTSVDTDAAIIDGRIIWEANDRLDFDLHAGILGTEGFDEYRYALGIGAGYVLRPDLRLVGGYNLVGFEDEDLDAEGYLAEGLYAGLRFKFDESLFRWLEESPK